MAGYDERYLDELRAAVPVSAVVSKKYKLIQPDGGDGFEFVVGEETYSVDDAAGTWSNGETWGDQFHFYEEFFGYSFDKAVEAVEKLLPPKTNGANGHAAEPQDGKLLAGHDGVLGYLLPSAARTVDGAKPENKLLVFKLQARELLGYAAKGVVEKIEIVDALHEIAETNGLIELNGEDEIQQILALAAEAVEPGPFKSRFGAKTWEDLDRKPQPYGWTVKGLVPRHDNMLIMGPSQSGKTFGTLDMVMSVVRGVPFHGRKTERLGVVYCSYEGQVGLENRIRAYVKARDIPPGALKNFCWFTRPPGLYAPEDRPTALANEILEVTKAWDKPIGAIVIDTHNSATRGSSEVKSDDIGKVLHNYDKLAEVAKAPLWIIGHTNKDGRHRGNEQIYNRIDTTLLIERVTEGRGQNEREKFDEHDPPRIIRRFFVDKQRDGEDKFAWDFVLERVEIGVDEDGEPYHSMVCADPLRAESDAETERRASVRSSAPAGAWHLHGTEVEFFRALLAALDKSGVAPPADVRSQVDKCPGNTVVAWSEVTAVYRRNTPIDDDTPEGRRKRINRIKTNMHRARKELLTRGVIRIVEWQRPKVEGVESPTTTIHYLWPTGRPVVGPGVRYPEQIRAAAPTGPPIDEATGQPMEDVPWR